MKRKIHFLVLMVWTGVMVACNNPVNPKSTVKDTVAESPAIVALKSEIALAPDSARLYDKIIDQYLSERNYLGAVAWCDSILARNDDRNFSYLFVKGDLQRQAQQYDSAINSYKLYLQRFPDDEGILLNLANTYAEAGRPESLTMSDDLLKRSNTRDTQADVFLIRGVYYSRNKNYSQAVENFDQAIVKRYSFWEAYLEKAIALYDAQQFDKSRETLNLLLQVNPSYPDAFYWIGKLDEAGNKKADAIKNYEAAYSLDKTFTDAKEALDRLKFSSSN